MEAFFVYGYILNVVVVALIFTGLQTRVQARMKKSFEEKGQVLDQFNNDLITFVVTLFWSLVPVVNTVFLCICGREIYEKVKVTQAAKRAAKKALDKHLPF